MMDSGAAFGAGKAGAPFDPIAFVTRPQVILRFLCWVCFPLELDALQERSFSV